MTQPSIWQPTLSERSAFSKSRIYLANKKGDKILPCLVPLLTLKLSDVLLCQRTHKLVAVPIAQLGFKRKNCYFVNSRDALQKLDTGCQPMIWNSNKTKLVWTGPTPRYNRSSIGGFSLSLQFGCDKIAPTDGVRLFSVMIVSDLSFDKHLSNVCKCTIRYDTRVWRGLKNWVLNLAHEIKTNNASAHLVQYRFKIREGSPEGIKRLWRKEMSYGWHDLDTTYKQRSRSFILVPIDFSYASFYRLSIVTFALGRTV